MPVNYQGRNLCLHDIPVLDTVIVFFYCLFTFMVHVTMSEASGGKDTFAESLDLASEEQ